MKKMILTSATVVLTTALVLFITLTAFVRDRDKFVKKGVATNHKKENTEANRCVPDLPFNKTWGISAFNAHDEKNEWKTKDAKEMKRPVLMPAKRRYFNIPVVDTTQGC
jgi:hypothetical protein